MKQEFRNFIVMVVQPNLCGHTFANHPVLIIYFGSNSLTLVSACLVLEIRRSLCDLLVFLFATHYTGPQFDKEILFKLSKIRD